MKANPNDIDIVTFLDQNQIGKLGKIIENFRNDNGMRLYDVDAYIVEVYPLLSKRFSYTIGNTAYWNIQFGSTKPNRAARKYKKGFLEIIY